MNRLVVVVVVVIVACGVSASSAFAFGQVAGSPFAVVAGPLAFDPNAGLLAAGNSMDTVGADGALTPVTGSPCAIVGVGDRVTSVAFSPDGGLLAVATNVGIYVCSVAADGTLTAVAGSPFDATNAPYSVVFSPDGGLLAAANYGSDSGSVSVFSVGAGGVLTSVAGSPFAAGRGTGSVAFSPGGGLLAAANLLDGSLSVFSVAPGGALTPVTGSPFALEEGSEPDSVAFSPSGGLLAVADYTDDALPVFSVGPRGALTSVAGSPFADAAGSPSSLAFSPSGAMLAVANAYGDGVSVLSVASGGVLTPVTGSPFEIDEGYQPRDSWVAFSPDGGLLAVADVGTILGGVSMFSTAVDAPSAVIGTPADDKTFNLDQAVATNFSCSEATGGTGISSCTDSNGATSPGELDTTSIGQHTYTVTAVSNDGQVGTASISYTVVSPPSAQISSPANGATFNREQTVATSFSCAEAANGPGVRSCTDSNGASAPSGTLDTSTLGKHTYAVTAASNDGQTASTTITYTVVGAPSVQISTPATGQTFNLNQQVPTSFSCSDATGAPGVQSCTDSNGATAPSGALNTSMPGKFSYTVTATSRDGQSQTATITYTIPAAPSIEITSPTDGAHYMYGQVVVALYGCQEGAAGPGIASCAGTVPVGQTIDTRTPGPHTFTVTATSSDGQRTTRTIDYTVAEPSNQFTLRRATVSHNGVVTLRLTLPGPGAVKILATASLSTRATQAIQFAAARLTISHAGLGTATLRPTRRGKQLITHHRYATILLRLTISYTPTGGTSHGVSHNLRITRQSP